jgi:hypothetical protein
MGPTAADFGFVFFRERARGPYCISDRAQQCSGGTVRIHPHTQKSTCAYAVPRPGWHHPTGRPDASATARRRPCVRAHRPLRPRRSRRRCKQRSRAIQLPRARKSSPQPRRARVGNIAVRTCDQDEAVATSFVPRRRKGARILIILVCRSLVSVSSMKQSIRAYCIFTR